MMSFNFFYFNNSFTVTCVWSFHSTQNKEYLQRRTPLEVRRDMNIDQGWVCASSRWNERRGVYELEFETGVMIVFVKLFYLIFQISLSLEGYIMLLRYTYLLNQSCASTCSKNLVCSQNLFSFFFISFCKYRSYKKNIMIMSILIEIPAFALQCQTCLWCCSCSFWCKLILK